MISLKFKKVKKAYGIRQSEWNALFNKSTSPRGFYEKKEEELKKNISRYFDIASENCEWNFSDIGWHHFKKGFFSNTYYISCSNCSGGKVSGNAEAQIAKVKIIKESGNPSSPKEGFFSTDVLEEFFVLWVLEINVTCNKCDKESYWNNIYTTYESGNQSQWNFSYFLENFSQIEY